MNLTRAQPRIVVRARDPVLRSLILERLSGLGDLAEEGDGTVPTGGTRWWSRRVRKPPSPRVRRRCSKWLAQGMANKEIAARLSFSTHTAKFHVESLLRKLEAVNRAEAVREGIRRGLIGV